MHTNKLTQTHLYRESQNLHSYRTQNLHLQSKHTALCITDLQ